jgi:CPA2 family monovalent cation:H+ antiporter-2
MEAPMASADESGCTHVGMMADVTPEANDVCPECVALGDQWVHLRVCMSCGHVGCCDESPNRHARRHYMRAGHPIIGSLEIGETWRYCFIDDAVLPDGRPLRKL